MKANKKRFRAFQNSVDANINTMKEVAKAVYAICNNSIVRPIQGIIFVGQGQKRYRLVISYANELSNGRIMCKILLIEEVGGQLQNVDNKLGALLTSIRMAIRIRWEIVRPFASSVRTLARLNSYKLRFYLQTCLNNIFSEAEFRGYYSQEDLLNAFDSDADKDNLMDIFDEFNKQTLPKLWQGIGFLDAAETFGEVSSEQSMTDRDLSLLES